MSSGANRQMTANERVVELLKLNQRKTGFLTRVNKDQPRCVTTIPLIVTMVPITKAVVRE